MSNNLDLVFLGGLFPKDRENEIYEKSIGPVQSAANNLQWNIVNGLDANCPKPVKIFNSLYVGAYPFRYRDLFIKTYNFSHCHSAKDINVGFINLPVMKHYFRYLSLQRYLRCWAMDETDNKVIIAYALTWELISCLKFVKKVNPKVITCMIIPDLPEYMNTTARSKINHSILKRLEINFINSNLQCVDYYVLLTEYMKEFIKIRANQYVVVEGISTETFLQIDTKKSTYKLILYTGTLNERYGVKTLVEAFRMIPFKEFRLILCGTGDSEEWIAQQASEDSRIIFKGQLKRSEVLLLQLQATVLVNPRQNNEVYTKYSFPSKILEYLSSGTPVVAYKLDGIPEEYKDYMFYVDDNSSETLANKLVEVCSMKVCDLYRFGKAAQDYVLRNKNSVIQTKKILAMLCENHAGPRR